MRHESPRYQGKRPQTQDADAKGRRREDANAEAAGEKRGEAETVGETGAERTFCTLG